MAASSMAGPSLPERIERGSRMSSSKLFFTRTFLVHPHEARRTILREIRRAKKELRLDAPAFMRTLAVLWVRHRRYKGVDPHDLYSPAELEKPNRPPF